MPTTRVILPPLGIFGLWLASRARHAYPPVRVLTSRAYFATLLRRLPH
jgi:hypothetical protein